MAKKNAGKPFDEKDLNDAQKIFIKNKVEKLGSINKVKAVYRRDDTVSWFAHNYAEKIF